MHPTIIAQRKGSALARTEQAAQSIAHKMRISPAALNGLTSTVKDPAVRELYRLEALASILEEVSAQFFAPNASPSADNPVPLPEPVLESVEVPPAAPSEIATEKPSDAKRRGKK